MEQGVCSNIPVYMVWLAFGGGMFIGGFLGLLAMCVLNMSRERSGGGVDVSRLVLENIQLKKELSLKEEFSHGQGSESTS